MLDLLYLSQLGRDGRRLRPAPHREDLGLLLGLQPLRPAIRDKRYTSIHMHRYPVLLVLSLIWLGHLLKWMRT